MTRIKEVVSWTIDSRIVEFIENKAKSKNRSRSFIANEILMEILNETI